MSPCTGAPPASSLAPPSPYTPTTWFLSTESLYTTATALATSESQPSLTLSPSDYIFSDHVQRLIIAILACVISAIGIPGNLLVIIAVSLSKRLQTKTNMLVANLACGDLLTCLIIPFQVYSLLQDERPYPEMLCVSLAVLLWLGLGSSVITLALIAFIRYYIITKPRQMYESLFRLRYILGMVVVAWLIPLLLVFVPPYFGVGKIGYSSRYRICTADVSNSRSDLYSLIAGLVVEVPCLVVIVVCYARIYLFIRQVSLDVILSTRSDPGQVHRVRGIPRTTLEVAVFRRQIRVAKNLFLVTCAYIVCVMPFSIMCIVPGYTYPVIPWTFLFGFLNTCINPFIYALKHPQFQEVLWAATCPWRRGRDTERTPLLVSGRKDTGNMNLINDLAKQTRSDMHSNYAHSVVDST